MNPMGSPSLPATSNVTIRDIAREVGVSIGTVSRALKGQPGLTEDTRQQVLEVARQMGYNLGKLRPVKARRIAFLLHRQHNSLSHNPFYSPVLHGVEGACRKAGVALSYASVGPNDSIDETLNLLEADALLCVGYFEPGLLTALRRSGKPIVLVDHFAAGLPSANTDNFNGAYLATQHLIASGRKRIAFISGPPEHYSIAHRLRGYRQALTDAGRIPDPSLEAVRTPPEDESASYEAMQRLLALPNPPDAVFAYNDATALLAIKACHDRGLRVPTDVAVVGFDDVAAAAHSSPTLTTVSVDKEALGREGVRLLLYPQPRGAGQVVVPVRLVLRQSSRHSRSR